MSIFYKASIHQINIILASQNTGITNNLQKRLAKHNAGSVTHTAKFVPWHIETYVGFSDLNKARSYEKYLKSGSGRAFAKKRL